MESHIGQEDAVKTIVHLLKEARANPRADRCSEYGYDLYVPTLLNHVVGDSIDTPQGYQRHRLIAPLYLSAAWELSRRGILRPGVANLNSQSTRDGAGFGYSITSFGRSWLAESEEIFVPTEPERFGQLISAYRQRFGPGFHQRAQEAIRCYGAHAYLACCAMSGAAAESILLKLAVEKKGDQDEVLRMYQSSGGRGKVENLLLGKANNSLRRSLAGMTDLVKYWRDESAHGLQTEIGDLEAYVSISQLLRLAMFASQNWTELTAPDA